MICVSSLRVWARIRRIGQSALLLFDSDLSFLTSFFDDADENILERETAFSRADDADAVAFEMRAGVALRGGGILIGDDVEALAEKRHAPALCIGLQKVHGALRLVDDEFQQASALRGFDSGGRAFSDEFSGDHKAEA